MHVYRNISLCCSFWYPKFCLPLAGRAVILTFLHSPVPLLREFFRSECFYAVADHANEFRATVTTAQISQRMCCQGLYLVLLLLTEHWLRKPGGCCRAELLSLCSERFPNIGTATSRTAPTQKYLLGIVFQCIIIYGILLHCIVGNKMSGYGQYKSWSTTL